IIVAGIGTGVGKTTAAAIFAECLEGDYWKPIECGDSDSNCVRHLIRGTVFSPAYRLQAPLSPHHAARLEGCSIEFGQCMLPSTFSPLIIEMAGGLLVPLNRGALSIDLFKQWEASWVLVSRHYLGSINHTLLTGEVLQRHGIPLAGIIFNGLPNLDSESAILDHLQVPLLCRLLPEKRINQKIIYRYAQQWKNQITAYLD
ncbi:MAG: dethiobiotin synthase, partial [Parachlamydia sp.]|nr:dethiobiotin synthase [Parachlamydia sp.]